MLALSNCKENKYYSICFIDVRLSTKIKRRLYDLGLLPGQRIKVLRKSLLKKAYLIEIRGYTLCLRNTIVQSIIVK